MTDIHTILIAGSGGTIAKALIAHWQNAGARVLTMGRAAGAEVWENAHDSRHLTTDLTDVANIPAITAWLKNYGLPDAVIVCSGFLHTDETADQKGGDTPGKPSLPEKALKDITDDFLLHNMQINLLAHIHLAQAVAPLLKRRSTLKWMSLSAMVGSITDNQLGGWYSYRMSKAALNMFIKTLSIEWQRKAPDSIVVATHPGTTDSALSEPFQANIKDGKLYTPELTAERLSRILEELNAEQNGHLLHWDGSVLPF
ncbi:MAG: cell-cell signaling protein CsgA [Oceanospirillaceae bacterium]|nr:cell-cell signaling protein CsgA [Oceanospirillaceae bacterium]MBT14028.1 cell-cell signaling protein CsgA [Oceanospirillaceae bacterium]|tara:strand:+ start:445 stop:1212 length:768 start_codon:yes stop_codon:yes gene_type:complete